MRSILQKSVWTLALCIFATSVYAQVSPKKFKKAKGIEVTYQNSYKGKVRPGERGTLRVGFRLLFALHVTNPPVSGRDDPPPVATLS